jgi:hypothetical protein
VIVLRTPGDREHEPGRVQSASLTPARQCMVIRVTGGKAEKGGPQRAATKMLDATQPARSVPTEAAAQRLAAIA